AAETHGGVGDGGLDQSAAAEVEAEDIVVNGAVDGIEVFGEGRDLAALGVEDHHADAISGLQFVQALASGIGHFLNHAAHAAADVEQKDEVDRLLFGGELQDGLLLAL